MTHQMGEDARAGVLTKADAELVGVDDQDDHVIRQAQQRQGVMNRPSRLARAIPGDDDASRRHGRTPTWGTTSAGRPVP